MKYVRAFDSCNTNMGQTLSYQVMLCSHTSSLEVIFPMTAGWVDRWPQRRRYPRPQLPPGRHELEIQWPKQERVAERGEMDRWCRKCPRRMKCGKSCAENMEGSENACWSIWWLIHSKRVRVMLSSNIQGNFISCFWTECIFSCYCSIKAKRKMPTSVSYQNLEGSILQDPIRCFN